MTTTTATRPAAPASPPASHPAGPRLDVDGLGVPLPGRTLRRAELRRLADHVAARTDLWEADVARSGTGRHYVSLYRDSHVDVWLLCWDTTDDTGWHDHDLSSGAVAVARGSIVEGMLRLSSRPVERRVTAGRSFHFGPEHIHRIRGGVDASVSIHAYSPPLWRLGQYAVTPSGVLRRVAVSYAEELRPQD